MSQIDVRTGMPPVKLDRSEFEKRYRRRFVDPAFKPLQRELDAIIGGDGRQGPSRGGADYPQAKLVGR